MKEKINKLSLCENEKCHMRRSCMRYKLKGDANDTWIEFKPGKIMGKDFCRQFIHINSDDAKSYILARYEGKDGSKYE